MGSHGFVIFVSEHRAPNRRIPKELRVPLALHDSLVNAPRLFVPSSISMHDNEILSPGCWGEAASAFFSSTGSASWVGASMSTGIHLQRSATPITFQKKLGVYVGSEATKQHSYALIATTHGFVRILVNWDPVLIQVSSSIC